MGIVKTGFFRVAYCFSDKSGIVLTIFAVSRLHIICADRFASAGIMENIQGFNFVTKYNSCGRRCG